MERKGKAEYRKKERQEREGSFLKEILARSNLTQEGLARLCAESEDDVTAWKTFINRLVRGPERLDKPGHRAKVKIILRNLQTTPKESLQIMKDIRLDEMLELGLPISPGMVMSTLDEITLSIGQLRQLLLRYGIQPEVAATPLTFCSATLHLRFLLSDFKMSLSEGAKSACELINKFSDKRPPITSLIADELQEIHNDKEALVERINSYQTGIDAATENVAQVGACFLSETLSRFPHVEFVLTDYSNCWLLALERFQEQAEKHFPPLLILDARGRILSLQDTQMWMTQARKHGWDFRLFSCNREKIVNYLSQITKQRKSVVLVGAEVVDLQGDVLTSPGMALICSEAIRHQNVIVAIAAQTFKVRRFEAQDYLWGYDQFQQPFMLDSLSPSLYSLIITDDGRHDKYKYLECCIKKWNNYLTV